MKKRAAALLCALLLVFMSACGSKSEPAPAASSAASGSAAAPVDTTPASEKIAIRELYSEEGDYETEWGFEENYSYHVPQLVDDTPDAAAINDEIAATYGALSEQCLRGMEEGHEIGCVEIGYDVYRNGDILSLVLVQTSFYEYYETYTVYNYDARRGEQIGNAALLDAQGMTQDEFLQAARCTAARCYDDWHFVDWDLLDISEVEGLYEERRCETISSNSIHAEMPLYLDEEGRLSIIAPIGAFVEADAFYEELPLVPVRSTPEKTASYGGFLTAVLKDGALTLRLEQNDEFEETLWMNGCTDEIPYGQALEVHGLYADYVDVFCGVLGESLRPYVFLLTSEGRIGCVDVIAGLRSGYFCAAEPLLGISDVVSFTAGRTDFGAGQVFAACKDGKNVELSQIVDRSRLSMSESFFRNWGTPMTYETNGDGVYEGFCWLDIKSGSEIYRQETLYSIRTDIFSEGYMTYMGMTEDGEVFCYDIWETNGQSEPYQGAVAMYTTYAGPEEDYAFRLHVKEMSGKGLIEMQPGRTSVLGETFG